MRKSVLLGLVLAAISFTVPVSAVQDQEIPDDSLGLSKTSVFDDPSPAIFEYGSADAGSIGKRSERSYMTAPPMIPHTIVDMVPITLEANLCRDCHVQPGLIGQKLTLGTPVPAPVSHYTDVKAGELYMGRWNCVQCHAPQAKVNVLVKSTFKKSK